jgi:S-adenosyl-L-methionine hydrolase (adenosine-forming)
MSHKIITLTSDFGMKDPYVAEMKATVLGIYPEATLIDISHEIQKFNIQMGAYILSAATAYFPKGTIHIAVVDPGVGTRRRSILIQTKQGFLIGPDNGVLSLAAERDSIENIYEISNPCFMLPFISNTFHGRDIFASVAAHLAKGVAIIEVGREIKEIVKPEFTKIVRKKDSLEGRVLHLDGFGNIITNITKAQIANLDACSQLDVKLSGRKVRLKICKTYGEAKQMEPLALIGSHGYLEIAINQSSAAEKLKVKFGDKITVLPTQKL